MGYKCAVRTATVMESSRLPLQAWLLAFYRMTTAKKGISSVQLAKELGVTQKTAWFLQQWGSLPPPPEPHDRGGGSG